MTAIDSQDRSRTCSPGAAAFVALLLASLILGIFATSSSHDLSDDVRTKAIATVQASVVSPKAGFDGACEAVAGLASPEPPADYFVLPRDAPAEARREIPRRPFNARAPPAGTPV